MSDSTPRRRIDPVQYEPTPRTDAEQRTFRNSVQFKAMRPDIRLSDLDEEEKVELSLIPSIGPDKTGQQRLSDLRLAAYADHVKAVTWPEELKQFAAIMTSTFGPEVRVWSQTMGWLEAFFVSQYGEEPSVWPTDIDEGDVRRATEWVVKNRWPNGVTRILDIEIGGR